MSHFDDICRICMQGDQELWPIFDEKYDENAVGIAAMLSECTKYKTLLQDGLPQHICGNCVNAVRDAYHFKLNCEKSYLYLKRMLTKTNLSDLQTKHVTDTHADKETQTELNSAYSFFDNDNNSLQLYTTSKHKNSSLFCCNCSKKFQFIEYLKNHKALFHPDSDLTLGSKSPLCQQQFSDEDYMQRHIVDVYNLNDTTSHNANVSEPDKEGEDGELEKYSINEVNHNNVHFQDVNKIEITDFEIIELTESKVHEMTKEIPPNAIDPTHSVLINDRRSPVNTCIKLENSEEEDTFSNDNEDNSIKDPVFLPRSEASDISSKGEKHKRCIRQHKNKHTCSVCDKSFIRKIELKKHLRDQCKKQFICEECTEVFITKHELHTHKITEGHSTVIQCKECGLQCKSNAKLIVHMRRHTGEKPFKCTFCTKGFPCYDDLKQHEKYHTGERNHVCETCGKAFQRKCHLSTHIRIHTGEKPYICSFCTRGFARTHDLKVHIRRHTGERLGCEFCEASFLQPFKLRQHKLIVHDIKEETPTRQVSKFITPQQFKENERQDIESPPTRSNSVDATIHLKNQKKLGRNHLCETCGKVFQRNYHLITHMRVHTGEKPYKCPHCQHAFAQNYDLKLHIVRHTGERLQCGSCDASFLRPYKLRKHKLIAHGINEKPPSRRVPKFKRQLPSKEVEQPQD